jgi:hypothetical protein
LWRIFKMLFDKIWMGYVSVPWLAQASESDYGFHLKVW